MKRITLPYEYTPRDYQLKLWQYMDGKQKHKRAVLVRHRRAGKDTDCINLCVKKMYEKVGIYAHIFPTSVQGRNVIWNGRTNTGRTFRSFFPDEIVKSVHENEMRITTENGSIYRVLGADDPDALLGMNITGAILSEFQCHDPSVWKRTIEPMLLANGGWAVFAFTPRGKNHGYKILERAKRENWFWEVLTIADTKDENGQPIIDEAHIESLRKDGMDEAVIQSEYYCSFNESIVGTYYASQMSMLRKEGRICRVPYATELPVDTAWDLGYQDDTGIWFIQQYGPFEFRAVDYFEANNESIPYYVRVLREKQAQHGITYGNHYFPHDIAVHDLSTGKTRIDVLRELGVRPTVVTKHAVSDGIEQVRIMLPKFWFDAERCERGLEALNEYHRAWDDKRKAFRYEPEHDWSSHSCLDGNTLIATARGKVPIRNVEIGDRVELGFTTGTVTNAGPVGVRDTLQITLSNGATINATPEHRFFASCGPWGGLLRADQLDPRHCLIDERGLIRLSERVDLSPGIRPSFPELGHDDYSVRVVSVESGPRSLVYDLTVDGHHCYFAAGVLVSNCDGFRTFVMGHRRRSKVSEANRQKVAVTEYDDI